MILKIICLNENVEEVFNITWGITSYIQYLTPYSFWWGYLTKITRIVD